MTNAPLVANRDALVRELHRHIGAHDTIVANDLLASGAVTTLAAALRELAVGGSGDLWSASEALAACEASWGDAPKPLSERRHRVRTVLNALADHLESAPADTEGA